MGNCNTMAESVEPETTTVTTPLVNNDTTEKKDDTKNTVINIISHDDEEEKKNDEEEEELKLDPNIVPADYNPEPRLSIAQTVTVPPYTEKRRLSKIEMKNKKKAIDDMTKALIQNPE